MEEPPSVGLLESNSSWEFLEIAALACFCAIHDHAFDMLFSFSTVVQHTPFRPVGFSVLKAGLNKSNLLSVYAASTTRVVPEESLHGRFLERKNRWRKRNWKMVFNQLIEQLDY